mmetsp:Transcript_61710/g.134952  ORF Transcript_61710/g.134952 Transcript_61710/m.134952 type:complete len:1227 (+) Transcript_61710:29-3709(+)
MSWMFQPHSRHGGDLSKPVQLGICAMEKKVGSKPMKAILELLTKRGDIQVIPFPEKTIKEAPIEEWPWPIDCLISFFSDGFPLEKAEEYVKLRGVPCVNDVMAQRVLLDRRKVYSLLEEIGIPHPQAIVVERDEKTGELMGEAAQNFEEGDDYIIVGETKLVKPFVEKPVDAEDHNICIYYPSSAGGGVKRLFRKVGDRSSQFCEGGGHVRRDKTYMYEPFMKTQGTDIKVYTVGPTYAHAEARKSPVIDGIVNRNEEGKEVRFPVVLTPSEKDMATRICKEFMQTVCGFDLLRTTNGSFVIDVNGWSFVKGLPKYYEDAAWLLHAHIMQMCGRHHLMHRVESLQRCHDLSLSQNRSESEESRQRDAVQRSDRWEHEELLAVIAIMRHGDRTPKNKMKLSTRLNEFLELHKKWAGGPRKEAKLKAPRQLQEVLDITYSIIGHDETDEGRDSGVSGAVLDGGVDVGGTSAEAAEVHAQASFNSLESIVVRPEIDEGTTEALCLIRTVLETGGSFDGIYRKVQLKPTAWQSTDAGDVVTEVQLVLKYGGILTSVGVHQAETLGHTFRNEMYPGEDSSDAGPASTGLLRLHATQRHDFKVYSSDEGRVQMSAASFSRGLLDLEKGSLTPVCVALVETDSMMLDDLPSAAGPLLEEAKSRLYADITGDRERSPKNNPEGGESPSGARSASPGNRVVFTSVPPQTSANDIAPRLERYTSFDSMAPDLSEFERVPRMEDDIRELQELVGALAAELSTLEPENCNRKVTKPLLLQKRWAKLKEDLWDKKKNSWDISKLPEIHDAVKFDLIHHPKLAKNFVPLYRVSKRINHYVTPHEYGWDAQSRLKIGSIVCGRLLRKIIIDLNNTLDAMTPCMEQSAMKEQETLPYLMRADPAKWGLRKMMSSFKQFRDTLIGVGSSSGSSPGDVPKTVKEELHSPAPTTGEAREEEDEEEAHDHDPEPFKEAEFAGLDPHKAGDLKSPHRRVRTRLYFTSESHIQTLMNVLRNCHLRKLPKYKSASRLSREASNQNQSESDDPGGSAPTNENNNTNNNPSSSSSASPGTSQARPGNNNNNNNSNSNASGLASPPAYSVPADAGLPAVPPNSNQSPVLGGAGSGESGLSSFVGGGGDAESQNGPLVCTEMEQHLRENPIFDYLTQIVFRLYEDKLAAADSPERFRVEVLFSPGAASDPSESLQEGISPLEPLRPLHPDGQPLTFTRLQELLSPFSNPKASG